MSGRRASKYGTHIGPNLDVIMGWMRSGMTEKSIAKTLGVGVSTWEHYKATKPEFREHIRKAQQDIGALCVNNLFKRANGYDYDEITTEITEGGNQRQQAQTGNQRRVIKKVTKHMPPDVGANCVILFNRMAKYWQNTQHIQHSGEIKGSGVLCTAPPMDKEAWLQFYKENVANGNGEAKEQTDPA